MGKQPERLYKTEQPSAAKLLSDAFKQAGKGKSYYERYGSREHFNALLLHSLGLATPEPDGKELLDRFVSSESILQFADNTRRTFGVLGRAHRLAAEANKGSTNKYQDELGEDLVDLAATQFKREGPVCPSVEHLLLTAPERYMTKHVDLKQQVFVSHVYARAGESDRSQDDAAAIVSLVLKGVGLEIDDEVVTEKEFYIQTGKDVLIRASLPSSDDIDDAERSKRYLETLRHLDKFWLKDPEDEAPRPFNPAKYA